MEQIPNQENKPVGDISSKIGAGVLAAAVAASPISAEAQMYGGQQDSQGHVENWGSYTTPSADPSWTTSPSETLEDYKEGLSALSEELTKDFLGKIPFAPNAKLEIEIEQNSLAGMKVITVKLDKSVQDAIFSVSVVVPDVVAKNKIALKALLTGLIQNNITKK